MSDGYKDPDRLKDLYHGEMMSLQDIGDEYGIEAATVKYWMKKYGIERRSRKEGRELRQRKMLPSYHQAVNGYMVWQTQYKRERHQVSVHRLLAVSEYGFDEVVEREVHHINEFKFDNRPDNIEVYDSSEHQQQHSENQKIGGETLLYSDEELKEFIRDWMDEYGEPPAYNEFAECSNVPHPRTYADRFGSWAKVRDALEEHHEGQ